MKFRTLLIVLVGMLIVSGSAWAQETESAIKESPRNMTAHIAFGAYKLSYIDDEFSGTGPAAEIFGDDYKFHFQLGAEYLFWQKFGTIGLEAATGYWQTSGKGLYRTSGASSSDTTTFHMVPLKLSAVYRFTAPWDKWNVPLVPFVKLGMDYYLWFIVDKNNSISTFESASGGESEGYGGTFGFHVSYGLQICLDFIDKKLAMEFDQDVGVNNTYLYFEGTFAKINDFWAGSSFDLSDHYFMGGLLVEI